MKKKNQNQPKSALRNSSDQELTFAEHLQDLRRRLLMVVGSILLFATVAYFVQQKLVAFLLRPAHNQHFIYTAPGGGIGFLFQICTYAGITLSIPVIIYQILRFIEPVIGNNERRYIVRMSWLSLALAVVGGSFGYLIGLPAALHFLSHQFTTSQISPLLTIQEYMSFITAYLIGSALIFQLPLVVLFINRIRPIKPSQLLGSERYVIAGALIVSMLMAPTINVVDQLILAGPIIAMYQVTAVFFIIRNRARRPIDVTQLLEQDHQTQSARWQVARSATELEPTSPFFAQFLQKNFGTSRRSQQDKLFSQSTRPPQPTNPNRITISVQFD